MAEREVISLDVDFTKVSRVIRKAGGSIWLSYCDTKGEWREIPITLIGLGDLLGSRVTLAGLQANVVEPKDVNRLMSSRNPTGRVIFQDDMAVLRWSKFDVAGTGAIALDSTIARYLFSNANCVRVTTGAAVGNETYGYKALPYPFNRRLGFEGLFGMWEITGLGTNVDFIWLGFDCFTGTQQLKFIIKYLKSGNKFQYLNSAGGWTDIPGGAYTYWNEPPFYMKLLVDVDAKTYLKVYINEKVFDLSGIPGYAAANTNPQAIDLQVGVKAAAAEAVSVFFTDVMVTDNEP